jgi:hypothetical protein
MQQSNAKQLVLSSLEAASLHHDIFELLSQISDLKRADTQSVVTVTGGSYK